MSWPSRLTDTQKQAILADYDAGEKVTVIAERHGVHHTYPTLLARRRGRETRKKLKNVRYGEKQ